MFHCTLRTFKRTPAIGKYLARRGKGKPFPWLNFLKSVMVIAIPVALQNLLTTTASVVDTMMIAPLGQNSVGALGLCAQFSTLVLNSYWGFIGGSVLFFSQYWGARDEDGINRTYGTSLSCVMLVGLLAFAICRFFPGTIMSIMTDKSNIADIGVGYLEIVAWSYPLTTYSMIMSTVLRSTERPRISLYASIASVGSNIILNWIFIYGKFGLPEMGVKGAALATCCAALINVVVLLALSGATRFPYVFAFAKHFKWSAKWIKEYLHKCFPIILNEVLIGVAFTCICAIMGHQSEDAIAAMAIYRTIEGMVIAFFSGLSSAASILVGMNVGAGDLEDAYQRAKRMIYVCALCMSIVVLVILAVKKPLLTAMGLSGNAYNIAVSFMRIYAVAAVIRMCNWTQNDVYRASGDATYGTVLEIVFMYIMVLPLVYLSGMVFRWPVELVFLLGFIDEPIRVVLMQVHMYSGRWIKPVTQAGRDALEKVLGNCA